MTENFETYRPLLFAIAYRMLGSSMEAEDAVQEAFLRYQRTPPDEIRALKPFLTTVVTRLCLDQLKSARAQRETYVGFWLPEPIRTGDDLGWVKPMSVENTVTARESVSMAFLILLEKLSPVERAVFLLREVFEFSYAEIAELVGKEEAACRQAFHRARQHIHEHRSRFRASAEARERITQRFLEACFEGSVDSFTRLLAEDVVSMADGGGKVSGAGLYPVVGREKVARLYAGLVRRAPQNITAEIASINGVPAVVTWVESEVFAIILLETDGEYITQICNVVNPDKLRHVQRTTTTEV